MPLPGHPIPHPGGKESKVNPTFVLRETALVRGRRYEAAARHASRRAGVNPRLEDGFCEVAASRLACAPTEPAFIRDTIEATASDFTTAAARWWYLGEQAEFAHVYLPERGPFPVLAVLPDGSSVEYADEQPRSDWQHWLYSNVPDCEFDDGEPAVVKVAGNPDTFRWLVETLRDAGWAVEVEVRG
ncbi:MAG: hypothetical protein KatS3mg015_2849 [Fimbriimonadales bacterium]|nr:MAG: hypothetical protein KatS3mg015_2849 [Fimbriimonadales bacterium]